MGSILCCVEDKRDYSLGKDEHFKPDFNTESENGIRMYIKQPLDKKDQVLYPIYQFQDSLFPPIFHNPFTFTYSLLA
jgi:hypothetical protein